MSLEPVRISGTGDPWTRRNLSCSGGSDDLTRLDPENLKIAQNDLRQVLDRRREQTALLRQRRTDMDRAQQEHAAKSHARDERFEEASAAAARREAADNLVEGKVRVFVDAWHDHFDSLRQLAVPDVPALTEALALWLSNLQGENPARVALQTAQQLASERLARCHSELTADRAKVEAEKVRLGSGVRSRPSEAKRAWRRNLRFARPRLESV